MARQGDQSGLGFQAFDVALGGRQGAGVEHVLVKIKLDVAEGAASDALVSLADLTVAAIGVGGAAGWRRTYAGAGVADLR